MTSCHKLCASLLHCVFAAEIKCVTLNQKIKSIRSVDDRTNCMPPCRSIEIIFALLCAFECLRQKSYHCISLAMPNAAAAAMAPINITFNPPKTGEIPVILALKYPKINKAINVIIAEIFKPSKVSSRKK